MSQSDYTDSQSEEYLSEHDSDREFIEQDISQQEDEECLQSEQEPSS
jgi:hypothetical protein